MFELLFPDVRETIPRREYVHSIFAVRLSRAEPLAATHP
jgi:hypothetical protein